MLLSEAWPEEFQLCIIRKHINHNSWNIYVAQMRFALKEYNKDIEVTCYAICFIKSQEELSYFLSIL